MPLRSHTCGELRTEDVGQTVTLEGWVARRRDHGGVIFIDLRDRYGLTQIVFHPDTHPEAHNLADTLRSEYTSSAYRGRLRIASRGATNPKLVTGEVEVDVAQLDILNKSKVPPFEIGEFDEDANENLRLQYRYLDLRRPRMKRNIILRHRMWKDIRDYYDENGFLKVETPFLTKSTPEGARDFLVPSRMNPGHFYALPQSPQLFKQMLMVSGIDKYFQIVRCFRDEDQRSNRQLEFTQLDVEISFANEEDVIRSTEGMLQRIFKTILDVDIELPIPRMSYADAMERYGCDSPDLRFALELVTVSDLAAESDFKVFKSVVESGGKVAGICARGAATFSRKQIDELAKLVGEFGAKGLAWFKVDETGLTSQIAKFFPEELQAKLRDRMLARPGDLLLFVAGKPDVVAMSLKELRLELGRRLGLIKEGDFKLVWIVDFPLFFWNEEDQRNDSPHHPFTAPKPEDEHLLDTEPLKVTSRAYDIVLNGTEIGGGSIRIHRPVLQQKIFDLLNISREEAEARFGFFLKALSYGAPPHGGIAFGLGRTLMEFLGESSLREVIAFPKNQRGQCLLTGAPSDVDPKQLHELDIRLLDEK